MNSVGLLTRGSGGTGHDARVWASSPNEDYMKIKDLSRDDLMALAQQTYEKSEWSREDIAILRACWREFEWRGGENAVMFFRPAFWGILKFHEVETGEVDEDYVLMLERTGSEIATDYRDVMRKLRGAASQ